MDLALKILKMIEECPKPEFEQDLRASEEEDEGGDGPRNRFYVEGYETEIAIYHVKLLAEAGLIEAQDASDMSGSDWQPISLTWDGHEFLEAAGEPSRWEKAKKLVKEKTGSLSFDVLKAVLLKAMTDGL
jgi:hypothetical protein